MKRNETVDHGHGTFPAKNERFTVLIRKRDYMCHKFDKIIYLDSKALLMNFFIMLNPGDELLKKVFQNGMVNMKNCICNNIPKNVIFQKRFSLYNIGRFELN
jgi:hypothetical protein